MAVNPYDNCPCGSGKKFRWCCTAYFDQIELGLTQQQEGQHEQALQTFQKLTEKHPDKPQVWGYYAHALANEGKTDEAEEVLQKAFAVQPDFPMGYLLRGLFRQSEGEVIGALLLFRKAAEAYSPEAHDQLAQVYEMIARNELMLNRPVASRAALERAVHFQPADDELRGQFDALFGDQSRMPEVARKRYAFRGTRSPVPAAAASGKLSDVKAAYEQLTKSTPDDAAAWFNLGLVRAWLGDQGPAAEALTRSLELEDDDHRAEETAALAEVLKLGQGMENDSDYVEHRVYMPVRDPEAVGTLLQAWSQEGRMIAAQMDESGQMFSALVVEELPALLETGTKMARVLANLTIGGGVIRLWHPVKESVEKVGQEVRDRINLAVGEPAVGTGPAQFGDIALEALAYPVRTAEFAEAETKLRDYAANHFENTWAHRPLRSLGGASPLDAVGSRLLRKRVLGVIKFLEGCVRGAAPRKQSGDTVAPIDVYDFDQLRHKLGIEMQAGSALPDLRTEAPAPAAAAPAAATPDPSPAAKRDVTAMSAAELAALAKDDLSAADLEDAMRAAIKLDARELAVAFAKAGAAKPADPAKPDRYPFYACLVTGALSEGDTAAAIRHAEAGAGYDAAHNAGKRANEYGLRKAALLAKSGDADAAAGEFDALLDRNPDDGNLYVKAAEAMLGARKGDRALAFAEKGLARARTLGNRDLEGACQELIEAARRYQ